MAIPNRSGTAPRRPLCQRIREKKIDMGHGEDDHEDYQGPNLAM